MLIYGKDQADGLIRLTANQMLTFIEHGYDLLVFVTGSRCPRCERLKAYLEPTIKEKGLFIAEVAYYGEYEKISQAKLKELGLPTIFSFPTGIAVNLGKVEFTDQMLEKEPDEFASEFLSRATYSNLRIANDTALVPAYHGRMAQGFTADSLKTFGNVKALIDSAEPVTILYSWMDCHDCRDLEDHVLTAFLRDRKPTRALYHFEVGGMWHKPEYQAMAKDVGLAQESFGEEGNRRYACVPALIHYEKGRQTAYMTHGNDGDIYRKANGKYALRTSFVPERLRLEADSPAALEKAVDELTDREVEGFLERYVL